MWPTASQPWVNVLRKMHFQPRRGRHQVERLPDVAPPGLKLLRILLAFPRLARRGPNDHARYAGFRAIHAVR